MTKKKIVTDAEINGLADRIADIGSGLPLQTFLTALGMVVTHTIMEFDAEDRTTVMLNWMATLTRAIASEIRRS